MKKITAFLIVTAGLLTAACTSFIGFHDDNQLIDGDYVTIHYEPSDEAFANPMKGFRPARYVPDNSFPAGEYVSTIHHLIKYTDLENSPGDTAQKIIDWSNKTWAGLEQRNIKLIPRIIIVNPSYGANGQWWPQGLDTGPEVERWVSETFKQRIAAFIKKLGEAWDNDPRVAAVETGIWGHWGEQHVWPLTLPGGGDRIPPDVQKVMGDAFAQSFKNKKLMIRYPGNFTDYDFGYYWDSFALPDDSGTGELIIGKNNWQTQMISGEIAYDWGDQSLLGGNPDGTLGSAANTDYVISWIKAARTSSLGWVANYNQANQNLKENAARMQKAFGYRYVVRQATYTHTVNSGDKLSVEFTVENTGSAPFYYQWPVELSLLNYQRKPVWTGLVAADIRNWLPERSYTVRGEFDIPESVPRGTYTLALAVLDPSGNLPSLRFANKNYYKGGRMPLGAIGIGQKPNSNSVGPFDSLYNDHTLYYKLEPASVPPEDRQEYAQAEEYLPVSIQGSGGTQKKGNLAFKKPVAASSVEAAYTNFADKVNDGRISTRWSSEWNIDPSWIYVDLETKTAVNKVILSWEGSFAKEYEIQVSDNGENWTRVHYTAQGKGGEEVIQFPAVQTRYVRVYCIQRALQWGYSIFEIEIYAP